MSASTHSSHNIQRQITQQIIHWGSQLFCRLQIHLPLIAIIVIAASLRWNNLNWDAGFHLHPDERFLTMVQLDLKLPATIANYLNPVTSSFNPQNQGHAFYVYGTLPLTLNKLLAIAHHTDTYNLATIQGRFLSGLADVGTVMLVYCLGQLLATGTLAATGKTTSAANKTIAQQTGIWAAGLYAVAVLPIQLSHFFTVDSFLVFFSIASLWASWRYVFTSRWRHVTQAGIFFGLALGCKLTAMFMVPLLVMALLTAVFVYQGKWKLHISWQKIGLVLLVIGWWLIVAYCTLRIASPNYFATANWLNPYFDPRFIQSVTQLKSFEGDDVWYPPAIQWIHKPPVWFALKNLAFYGVGLPWFGLALVGIGLVGWRGWQSWRRRHIAVSNWLWLGLLGWTIGFFTHQSIQFVKVIRYFNLLYPILALLAGLGLSWLVQQLLHWRRTRSSLINKSLISGIIAAMLMAVLVWPAAFMSIYLQPHSRVTASIWLQQQVPNGSKILSEYWDDALPLTLPGTTKTFAGEEIHVFDPDTSEKWLKLNQSFATADYYILSSNRAWASIMPLPEKYPQMAEYYRRLLADQTEWQLVKTITSYPSLRYLGLPIEFNTDGADEAFTVYDHPKVLIFTKPYHAQSKLMSQPLFTQTVQIKLNQ